MRTFDLYEIVKQLNGGFKYKIHLKIKREELTENESSAKGGKT